MNRLEQKCIIASAGAHVLLVTVLLVGPAFFSRSPKPVNLPTIDFIPSILVDGAFAGGGNRHATPPPPLPPAPPVQNTIQPVQQQETVVRHENPPPRIVETGDIPEPRKPVKKQERDINTTLVTRNQSSKKTEKPSHDTTAREQADARRRSNEAVSRALAAIKADTSKTTSIDSDDGPGGGGPSYASYDAYVKTIYENNWTPPATANDDAIVKATVTIERDGNVFSSHISQGSGDAGVDESIRRTLINVAFIAPFPAGSKDDQRTYTISFNLKSKRMAE